MRIWDDEPGHLHYHQILQISGVKKLIAEAARELAAFEYDDIATVYF